MDDKRKSEAIAAARAQIARRIARLCTTLTEEELARLLDHMAYVQWKYDVGPIVAESQPSRKETRQLTD
jgi:hypothetical protein